MKQNFILQKEKDKSKVGRKISHLKIFETLDSNAETIRDRPKGIEKVLEVKFSG